MSTLRPYHPSGDRAPHAFASFAWLLAIVAGGLYGAGWALSFPDQLLLTILPLLALALLVIWTLPTSANPPIRALEVTFFAFFVGYVIWPNYLAFSLPGLPWITLGRIIAAPLMLFLLICLSVSPDFRRTLKETLAATPWIAIPFAVFVALQLISVGLSRDIVSSSQKFVVAQLYWTAIFITGIYVFRTPGRIRLWCVLLCAMLIPLGVSGLIEFSRGQVPWANHIPSFLAVEDESVARILGGKSRPGGDEHRLQSTFSTSLTYAEYMALTIPFLLHFMMGPSKLGVRIASAGLLVFTFYMILLTDSRLGAVGFFMSVLLYVFFWAWRLWIRDRDTLVAPAIVVGYPVALAMFIFASFHFGRLRTMIWGGGQHRSSNDARMEQYDMGMDILTRNPFGHGVGQGASTLNFHNAAGVVTIDTYYMSIALEYGVLGFFIYYGMFLIAIYKGATVSLRDHGQDRMMSYAVPLAIALSVFVVIKSILSLEENHPVVFMMLAMLVVILHRAANLGEEEVVGRFAKTRAQKGAARYRRPLFGSFRSQ